MKSSIVAFFTTLCCVSFLLFFATCSSEKKEEKSATDKMNEAIDEVQKEMTNTAENVEGSYQDAVNKMNEAMEQLKSDGKVVEPVNFRVLKEGVPETFLGMKRTKNEGETSGTMGFKVSTAKAAFEEGDKYVEIEIIDVGGIGMAAMGMAAWAMAEIDKETEDGFERTTKFEGHKAFEKCRDGRCEFSTWLNQRVIFNVRGTNVSIDDLKKGVKNDVNLSRLISKVAEAG